MNGYKYLLKNMGLLTLSSFATKLLSFFLVPFYTNILTSSEYGTYDLFSTTIGILVPILTLNMEASVLRFTLDSQYDKKAIISVANRYLCISNFIVFFGLAVNSIFHFNSTIQEYAVVFFFMFFTRSLSEILVAYIRGSDKIADLSVSSVVASVITIVFNILFLAVFQWGLWGYFFANISGALVQSIYLIVRSRVIREVTFKRKFTEERKAMVEYSKPMIANSIAWWVNGAFDRYVILFFCGVSENGIYSVASKIPSILNIFQSIFSQAWGLSAVRDFDAEDKNGFFSNTYKAYNCLMVLTCSAVIITDKILAQFLYAKEFYLAWRYVPWLTIAIVFGAMSGYLGGFFSAVKNSKIFAQSSLVGAGTNILLNLIFTPFMGALGAAIATTICYFVIWVMRYQHSKHYIKMEIALFRDVVSYVLLVVQAIGVLVVERVIWMYAMEILLFLCILLLYAKDIRMIFYKILKSRQRR